MAICGTGSSKLPTVRSIFSLSGYSKPSGVPHAEQNGRREMGSSGGGGRFDYGYFDDAILERYADEAVKAALVNLDARPAPAGPMTIVLGPGWPGVLLHEAVGHGLEGDFNRKGSSAYAGRIGERVAAKGVTVVDDGTLKDRRGSLNMDDEGNPTQCTTLIEDGILRGYMHDRMSSRHFERSPSGNGRRESFASHPMPRMTNTILLAGPHDPDEIVRGVKHGIYARKFGGGQVDITSGKYVFQVTEAYKIDNGKLGAPLKGAMLIGNGPHTRDDTTATAAREIDPIDLDALITQELVILQADQGQRPSPRITAHGRLMLDAMGRTA